LEVAWLLEHGRLHIRSVFAISIAERAMAADTKPAIRERGIFGVTGSISDMTLRGQARIQVILRQLRPQRHRERQNRSCAQ
jgi:hypothetical protein